MVCNRTNPQKSIWLVLGMKIQGTQNTTSGDATLMLLTSLLRAPRQILHQKFSSFSCSSKGVPPTFHFVSLILHEQVRKQPELTLILFLADCSKGFVYCILYKMICY